MPKMIVYAGQGYKTKDGEAKAKVGERLAVPRYGIVIARVPNDGSTRQQRRAEKRG